jgi:hypothetical protein
MFDHCGQYSAARRLKFTNDQIGIDDNRSTASKLRRDR